jgi:hypothetical protein
MHRRRTRAARDRDVWRYYGGGTWTGPWAQEARQAGARAVRGVGRSVGSPVGSNFRSKWWTNRFITLGDIYILWLWLRSPCCLKIIGGEWPKAVMTVTKSVVTQWRARPRHLNRRSGCTSHQSEERDGAQCVPDGIDTGYLFSSFFRSRLRQCW